MITDIPEKALWLVAEHDIEAACELRYFLEEVSGSNSRQGHKCRLAAVMLEAIIFEVADRPELDLSGIDFSAVTSGKSDLSEAEANALVDEMYAAMTKAPEPLGKRS